MKILSFAAAVALICQYGTTFAQSSLPTQPLKIGAQTVTAEIANHPATRQQGLMFRGSMPTNHGMLFVFEQAEKHCFWMKNTPLPLTIAFIDEKGMIVTLLDMAPLSEQNHCALKPAKYALEMNQGWFKKHKLGLGQKVQGVQGLKAQAY